MSDIFGLDTDAPRSIGELAEGIIGKMDDTRLPLGIHFGLDEDKYHADPGMGSSSIRDLAFGPVKYQYDKLRPRERVETEAMTFGKALHCRVLEGKEAFDNRYARPPHPKDEAYKNALVTTEDIKEVLRQHGQKLTGTKPDLIERAREIDDCPPIFDDILKDWHEKHPDHQEITPRQAQEVEDAVMLMQRDPTLRAVMQAGSLINGAAELSIIYELDGVRRKARFDYALAPAGQRVQSLIVDLKAFSTFRGATDEQAGINKIYEMAYEIQAAYYLQAIEPARKLLAEGKVFGDAPSTVYLEQFLNAPAVNWVWVMIRRDKGLVPITITLHGDDPLIEKGNETIAEALVAYERYMAEFGPDQLWSPPPRLPLVLNASHFPTWNRGLLHEQPEDR